MKHEAEFVIGYQFSKTTHTPDARHAEYDRRNAIDAKASYRVDLAIRSQNRPAINGRGSLTAWNNPLQLYACIFPQFAGFHITFVSRQPCR